jgi:hypothetical protein
MQSFRRLALLLVLVVPAIVAVQAQSTSTSSSSDATAAPDQAQPAAPNQGQLTVQARIKARREQRRVAAIHENYSHLYEAYVGTGFLRFTPGAALQRVNEYIWNVGFTRYYSERLGVTIDGRGSYGTAFIERPVISSYAKPAVNQYSGLIGPTYRFYLQPRFSISGRVLAGFTYGNFSGDTGGNTALSTLIGLYPDGSTYAANAGLVGEYNISPVLGVRVAPEYQLTGFGSTQQNNLGFTAGLVYRFGKR